MIVADAVLSRRSVRDFAETPVPFETILRVLDQARWAPSGCNFQPWEATVMTGAALKALQDRLLSSAADDPLEYDYMAPAAVAKYRGRVKALGAAMYGAMGIARDDRNARDVFTRANCVSFGAPVLLLCHFPKLMKEAQWADVGMWLQTIMLLLRGEGLDSCPQEYIGHYGRTIKAHLGMSEDTMLFCGMAIGHRRPDAPVNNFGRERATLAEQVTFLGFAEAPAIPESE